MLLGKLSVKHPGIEVLAAMPPIDLGLLGEDPPLGAAFDRGPSAGAQMLGSIFGFMRNMAGAAQQRMTADALAAQAQVVVRQVPTGIQVVVHVDPTLLQAAAHLGEDGIYDLCDSIGTRVALEMGDAVYPSG